MSAMPVKCYQPKCDGCGAIYESDDPDVPSIFVDSADALAWVSEIGWLLNGSWHLTCPSCLRCSRCGSSPAMVGGPEYEAHRQILCDDCEPQILTVVPQQPGGQG